MWCVYMVHDYVRMHGTLVGYMHVCVMYSFTCVCDKGCGYVYVWGHYVVCVLCIYIRACGIFVFVICVDVCVCDICLSMFVVTVVAVMAVLCV